MIRRQFFVIFKSDYMDLSLCSSYLEQRGPLACSYKAEGKIVKRQS